MSEVSTVINATKRFDKARTQIEIIKEAMKQDAIQNAKNNISDDVMDIAEYDKEVSKAVTIMEDAIYLILSQCNTFGDDSILQETDLTMSMIPKYSCHSFMESILNQAVENVDEAIN